MPTGKIYFLLEREYDPKLRAALERRGFGWFFELKEQFDSLKPGMKRPHRDP